MPDDSLGQHAMQASYRALDVNGIRDGIVLVDGHDDVGTNCVPSASPNCLSCAPRLTRGPDSGPTRSRSSPNERYGRLMQRDRRPLSARKSSIAALEFELSAELAAWLAHLHQCPF